MSDLILRATSPGCEDGTCPNIKQHGETGVYWIQGYTIRERAELDLPDGEDVVEIPADVMAHLLAQLR